MGSGAYELGYGASAALGLFFLAAAWVVHRKGDRAGRVLLALFLLLIGLNYLLEGTYNLLRLEGIQANGLRLVGTLAGMLDPPVLLLYAWRAAGDRPSRFADVLALAPAVLLVGARLLLGDLPEPMPGIATLHVVNLATCYLLALGAFARGYLESPSERTLDARGTILLAFGLAVLPRLPLVYADLGFARGMSGRAALSTLIAFEGALLLLYLAFAGLLLHVAPPAARRHARRTLQGLGWLLLAVAALWGLRFVPALQVSAFGLLYPARWFLVAAVVVTGLRRHELLGLPADLSRAGRVSLNLLLGSAAAFTLAAVLANISNITPMGALASGIAMVAIGGPVIALAGRAIAPEPEREWRREAVYRAHLQMGTPEVDLARVRAALGLSEEDAREVAALLAVEQAAPKEARRLEVGASFLGRYDVVRLAGAGAFGRAYEARDRLRGERVVLKELREDWRGDAEALARFRREAQVALQMDNPYLVRFRGLEEADGGPVLVLDHVAGTPLRERIAQGPLPPAAVARIADDLLDALAALHGRGILHRDVKPENVIVRPDGHAVLLDFGSATAPAQRGTLLAGRGAHPGTPVYMSPEQERGADLTPASDLYALAVLLWEALSHALPPGGEVPASWRPVLARALSRDPAARFADATAFRDALPRS